MPLLNYYINLPELVEKILIIVPLVDAVAKRSPLKSNFIWKSYDLWALIVIELFYSYIIILTFPICLSGVAITD